MRRFAYQFCREHHIEDVDAFLARTPMPRLKEWMASYRLDHSEQWQQTAMICLSVFRAMGGNKHLKLDDFLPKYKSTPKQSGQQRLAAYKRYAMMKDRKQNASHT